MNNGKSKKMNTRTLTQAAFLVALSIVLTRFGSIMVLPTLRIGIGDIPLMMTGMLFGPIVGGIGGIAADLIGIMINPQGPPHFGFTLTSMLFGVIPGLYVIYFKRKGEKSDPYSSKNIIIMVTTCILILSLGLNTYWLSQLYNKGIIVMLPGRAVSAAGNIIVQSIVTVYMMKFMKRIIIR